MQDPELSIEQAMTDYRRLGYPENWINQRIKTSEIHWNAKSIQKSIDDKNESE